jgi:serine/threonine protein kinase
MQAINAATGMLYLHQRSPPVIHRDLKSPNLLVCNDWTVKVSDFNLSKILDDTTRSSSIAAMNPRWLAPEIFEDVKADQKADVFAFGVCMWELLTWQIPWNQTNPWTVSFVKLPNTHVVTVADCKLSMLLQIVSNLRKGLRPVIPAVEDLPGPDNATFDKLPKYMALMNQAWHQNPAARPDFKEVVQQLKAML